MQQVKLTGAICPVSGTRLQEQEVQNLRQQMTQLQTELADSRHQSLEQVNALKAEVEAARKQHDELKRMHADVNAKSKEAEGKVAEVATALALAQKAKRAAEAELQSIRDRQLAADGALAEASKAKEALERQLAASHTKHQDLEDALLELERDQTSWKHKADQVSTELLAETKRRELLESAAKQHERSVATLREQMAAKQRELAQAKDEIAAAQNELKHTKSMQNKTIVEHVHVLEEAKKYTDRQLADAQSKLQELAHYTKTLEKSKARLLSDNEDLSREVSQLQQGTRLVALTWPHDWSDADEKLALLVFYLQDGRQV